MTTNNVNPTPTPTPMPNYGNNSGNSSGSGSKRLLPAAIAVIIALLGINAYLLYNKSQQSAVIEQKSGELDEAEKLKADLEKQFAEATASLDEMRTQNAELNKVIDQQKADLLTQKDKISQLLSNKADLGRAKAELAKLKDQVTQYIAQVNQLKQENQQLSEKNTSLTTEKENLSQNLEKERTQRTELESAKAELTSQKEKVESENKVLSKKVNAAAVVKADAVTVTTFEVDNKGREDKAKKSKNVNRLQICFKALANNVADAGSERFFVRIISPTGETLATQESGSGRLKVLPNNQEVLYTVEDQAQYNNKDTNVCIKWDAKNITMPKGNYEVEVYNKGYLCGKGNFKIKGNGWF